MIKRFDNIPMAHLVEIGGFAAAFDQSTKKIAFGKQIGWTNHYLPHSPFHINVALIQECNVPEVVELTLQHQLETFHWTGPGRLSIDLWRERFEENDWCQA